MNPIEHVWDFIGRKINQRNPKCQNIDELRTAILQEWHQFPQEREIFIILKDVTMMWQKWGSKQALEKRKTSLSLMEVFNIALKCSLQILYCFNSIDVKKYIDKNIGWCLTFVGVYIYMERMWSSGLGRWT
jgi:hypothetical protein